MKIHSDWQVKSCLWACNSPRHLLSIIPSNAPFSTLCFPQICAQVSAAKFFSGLEISGIIFCACVLSSQVFCPAKCDHYTLPHFSFSVFSAEGLCLPSVSYHWLCCHWESTKVVCCVSTGFTSSVLLPPEGQAFLDGWWRMSWIPLFLCIWFSELVSFGFSCCCSCLKDGFKFFK